MAKATIFAAMRLNSDKALALASAVLAEHGGDWEKVAASGHVRADGVIVIKRPAAFNPGPLNGAAVAPRRAARS